MFAHSSFPKIESWAKKNAPKREKGASGNIYFFLDTECNVLSQFSKPKGCTANELAGSMVAVVKHKGKGLTRSKYLKLLPSMEKAEKLIEVGYYGEAYKKLKKIAKYRSKPIPPLVDMAKQSMEAVDERVSTEFEEIKAKIQSGEKEGALVRLYFLKAAAKGMKIVKEISNEVTKLEKDKDLADALDKASREKKAYELYLKAELSLADGKTKSGKNYLERIGRSYKDTSVAEKARERLEDL